MRPDAMSQYEDEPEPEPVVGKESWEEEVCGICCSRWQVLRSSNSNGVSKHSSVQFPGDELLALMDTALDEPPENVMLCAVCSMRIGKLQKLQEDLARVQTSMMELQKEIASQIAKTEGNGEDNDVRASICKRWRSVQPAITASGDSNNSDESEDFRLVDIKSKIPRDLIISPAVNSDTNNEESMDGEDNRNEIQFHLDPRMFEVVEDEEDGIKSESMDGYENGGSPVECIEVDDESDDEENEVDAASLIPAIEISAIDSDQVLELHEVVQQPQLPSVSQPNIYFSTDGTRFTQDLDSLFPPDSPHQNAGSEGSGDSSSSRRVMRSRQRSSNGVGKPYNRNCPEFKCTICPEIFRTREKFKEHLETHNGKAPTCAICQKVFPRKHNLIIHMRTHTGEKPYDCPVCHKPYSDRSNFNAHVRKHMAKPYGCTICMKMFESSQAAHAHAQSQHPEKASGKIISKVTFKNQSTA